MSNRSRSILAAGTLIAVAAALTGCSTAGSNADGTTTVTVMYTSNEFAPEYVEDFESTNPDIKIKLIEFDQNRLNAMLTAGDPPDLVRGTPSANLFARGLATPLDSYVAGSEVIRESDLMAANDLWRWDGEARGSGQLYGIIKDFSPDLTIWQNTAVFEAAGVEPLSSTEPSSWDEVLETAKALKASGIETTLGLNWAWGVSGVFQTMVEQQGSQIYNSSLTEAQLNTPEGIRAIQWLIDYGKAGVGTTSLNPPASGDDTESFLTGELAALQTGYWFGGGLVPGEDTMVGNTAQLVPTPTFGERVSPVLGGVGAWIPEASKHKDAAWRVMEYFMAGKPATDRASSGWGLPALESLWELIPTTEPYQAQAKEVALDEVTYFVPLQDSPYINSSSWGSFLDKELQEAIQGNRTAKQVAESVEDEMNKLLAQGKDQLG